MKSRLSILLVMVILIPLVFNISFAQDNCESLTSGDWNQAATWTNCSGSTPDATDNVTIKAGHTVTQTAFSQNMANLTIEATGVLDDNSKRPNVTGNVVINGSLISTGSSGRWNLKGAGTTVNGTGSVTTDRFKFLDDKTILSSTDLTFTSGFGLDINTTTTELLKIINDATSTTGSSSSFVDGPMKKIGNDAFTFPVGDGSIWARLGISAHPPLPRNILLNIFILHTGIIASTLL